MFCTCELLMVDVLLYYIDSIEIRILYFIMTGVIIMLPTIN